MSSPYSEARKQIDEAHAADPKRGSDGRAAELVYAENMEAWLLKLEPQASEILRLAARCQHLERWSVPRSSFPMDKVGYHAWRKSLYVKQAERAVEIFLKAGIAETEAREAQVWISKTGLKTNAGTQALEDAACLVFLDSEIAAFATQHQDFNTEKYVDILKKTWKKMSPKAQAMALAMELPPPIRSLLQQALT